MEVEDSDGESQDSGVFDSYRRLPLSQKHPREESHAPNPDVTAKKLHLSDELVDSPEDTKSVGSLPDDCILEVDDSDLFDIPPLVPVEMAVEESSGVRIAEAVVFDSAVLETSNVEFAGGLQGRVQSQCAEWRAMFGMSVTVPDFLRHLCVRALGISRRMEALRIRPNRLWTQLVEYGKPIHTKSELSELFTQTFPERKRVSRRSDPLIDDDESDVEVVRRAKLRRGVAVVVSDGESEDEASSVVEVEDDDDVPNESLTGPARFNKDVEIRAKRARKSTGVTKGYSDSFSEDVVRAWSEARIVAWNNRYTNPNAYYYRFTDPNILQANGQWSADEKQEFKIRVAEFRANGWRLGTCWGIFSKSFPHRVGYQCSAYYRKLILEGQIDDPSYELDDGKLVQSRPDLISGREDVPQEMHCLTSAWNDSDVLEIEAQVNDLLSKHHPNHEYVRPEQELRTRAIHAHPSRRARRGSVRARARAARSEESQPSSKQVRSHPRDHEVQKPAVPSQSRDSSDAPRRRDSRLRNDDPLISGDDTESNELLPTYSEKDSGWSDSEIRRKAKNLEAIIQRLGASKVAAPSDVSSQAPPGSLAEDVASSQPSGLRSWEVIASSPPELPSTSDDRRRVFRMKLKRKPFTSSSVASQDVEGSFPLDAAPSVAVSARMSLRKRKDIRRRDLGLSESYMDNFAFDGGDDAMEDGGHQARGDPAAEAIPIPVDVPRLWMVGNPELALNTQIPWRIELGPLLPFTARLLPVTSSWRIGGSIRIDAGDTDEIRTLVYSKLTERMAENWIDAVLDQLELKYCRLVGDPNNPRYENEVLIYVDRTLAALAEYCKTALPIILSKVRFLEDLSRLELGMRTLCGSLQPSSSNPFAVDSVRLRLALRMRWMWLGLWMEAIGHLRLSVGRDTGAVEMMLKILETLCKTTILELLEARAVSPKSFSICDLRKGLALNSPYLAVLKRVQQCLDAIHSETSYFWRTLGELLLDFVVSVGAAGGIAMIPYVSMELRWDVLVLAATLSELDADNECRRSTQTVLKGHWPLVSDLLGQVSTLCELERVGGAVSPIANQQRYRQEITGRVLHFVQRWESGDTVEHIVSLWNVIQLGHDGLREFPPLQDYFVQSARVDTSVSAEILFVQTLCAELKKQNFKFDPVTALTPSAKNAALSSSLQKSVRRLTGTIVHQLPQRQVVRAGDTCLLQHLKLNAAIIVVLAVNSSAGPVQNSLFRRLEGMINTEQSDVAAVGAVLEGFLATMALIRLAREDCSPVIQMVAKILDDLLTLYERAEKLAEVQPPLAPIFHTDASAGETGMNDQAQHDRELVFRRVCDWLITVFDGSKHCIGFENSFLNKWCENLLSNDRKIRPKLRLRCVDVLSAALRLIARTEKYLATEIEADPLLDCFAVPSDALPLGGSPEALDDLFMNIDVDEIIRMQAAREEMASRRAAAIESLKLQRHAALASCDMLVSRTCFLAGQVRTLLSSRFREQEVSSRNKENLANVVHMKNMTNTWAVYKQRQSQKDASSNKIPDPSLSQASDVKSIQRCRISDELFWSALDFLADLCPVQLQRKLLSWRGVPYLPENFYFQKKLVTLHRQVPLRFCSRLLKTSVEIVAQNENTFVNLWFLGMLEMKYTCQLELTTALAHSNELRWMFASIPDKHLGNAHDFSNHRLNVIEHVLSKISTAWYRQKRNASREVVESNRRTFNQYFANWMHWVIDPVRRDLDFASGSEKAKDYMTFVKEALSLTIRYCADILYHEALLESPFKLFVSEIFGNVGALSNPPAPVHVKNFLLALCNLPFSRDMYLLPVLKNTMDAIVCVTDQERRLSLLAALREFVQIEVSSQNRMSVALGQCILPGLLNPVDVTKASNAAAVFEVLLERADESLESYLSRSAPLILILARAISICEVTNATCKARSSFVTTVECWLRSLMKWGPSVPVVADTSHRTLWEDRRGSLKDMDALFILFEGIVSECTRDFFSVLREVSIPFDTNPALLKAMNFVLEAPELFFTIRRAAKLIPLSYAPLDPLPENPVAFPGQFPNLPVLQMRHLLSCCELFRACIELGGHFRSVFYAQSSALWRILPYVPFEAVRQAMHELLDSDFGYDVQAIDTTGISFM